MTTERNVQRIQAVCLGECRTDNSKLGQLWRKLTPDGSLMDRGTGTLVLGKGVKGARVGQVWELAVDGSTVWIGGDDAVAPRFQHLWPKADDRAAWEAVQAGERAQHREARRVKQAGTDDPLDELLAPLGAAYLKADSLGRRMLLAKVIQKLTAAGIRGRWGE